MSVSDKVPRDGIMSHAVNIYLQGLVLLEYIVYSSVSCHAPTSGIKDKFLSRVG